MKNKQVIIITGVGKGFGLEILKNLSENHNLIGITRSQKDIEKIKKLNLKNCKLYCLDLTDFISVNNLINEISKSNEIHGLINNAGIRCRMNIETVEIDTIENVFKTNVFTSIMLSKLVLPNMKKNKYGSIINISSILSKSGMKDLSIYSASKGAIDSFTKSLAVEVAEFGINVNAIAPGFCKTSYYSKFRKNSYLLKQVNERIPLKYWGDKDEINGICRFLLSREARYITGQVIFVDGGWTAA